ncbi:DUF6630 family protein [Lysobacter xanthus]
MHSEFDPDDNFAQAFDTPSELDDEAALEAVVWQLLLLVNPGDEDSAAAQFAAWQEAGPTEDVAEAIERLDTVTEWKSGFRVDGDDTRGLVESLDELASRWNLRIDWGVEDPTDDDFLNGSDVPELIGIAFDRLREHHYTLWVREAGDDGHAGWITQSRDDEAMRMVAGALGLHLRPGGA